MVEWRLGQHPTVFFAQKIKIIKITLLTSRVNYAIVVLQTSYRTEFTDRHERGLQYDEG